MKKKTNLLLLVLIIVAITAVLVAYFLPQLAKEPMPTITSFEECSKAGYPVLESYPARCVTPNGQSFTQNIGNELDLRDLITIQHPRPNQTITSPLDIRGAARGSWFFEASFPIKLVDTNGKIITQTQARATEEWMTENFVPYKATLEFKTDAKRGVLILEKDNPSGLSENAKQLEIPVNFK